MIRVKLSSRLRFPFLNHERVRPLNGLMIIHVRLNSVKQLLRCFICRQMDFCGVAGALTQGTINPPRPRNDFGGTPGGMSCSTDRMRRQSQPTGSSKKDSTIERASIGAQYALIIHVSALPF
jgi:hypothetical protein